MPILTIDHQKIEVPAGTKVIEAAEQLGVMIPRFCYHPALGSVGACRVCAVAFIDGPVKGIQMSCMINAQDEMVVSTTDEETVDFRRHVIEWLMLNHPHDCPVCDEGGHCLLQDLTVSGGHGMRRYQGMKRTYHDQYLGPLIQHEMNRCIHCYRCARYYQEFAGAKDLGVMGIGARVYFGRSKPGTLESPFAGNLIDLCPTGVYTDKPSRFIGRRWDFERAPSVCLHCSLGCHLVVSARYRRIVRHEARPNADVNGYFICDRGRYGYFYNDSPQRPRQAMVQGQALALEDAVSNAKQRLERVAKKYGPGSVALVGSVRSNLETLAALSRLCRRNQWDDPVFIHETRKAKNLRTAVASMDKNAVVSMGAVSVAEYILVIGVDPVQEAPMLALSLRRARQQGGHIVVIDPRSIEMPLDFVHLPMPPLAMTSVLDHVIETVCAPADAAGDTAHIHFSGPAHLARKLEALTAGLCQCRRAVIICGTDITTPEQIGKAAVLYQTLRNAGTEAKLFFPLMGANAFAAGRMMSDDKAVDGLVDRIEQGQIKALMVVENDLWGNYANRPQLIRALKQLEALVVLDYMASPLINRADVFIPTQTLYETGGHWINHEARLQTAAPVLTGGTAIELLNKGGHPPRVFENTIPGGTAEAAHMLLPAFMMEDKAKDSPPGNAGAAATAYITSLIGPLRSGRRIDLDTPDGSKNILPEEIMQQKPEENASHGICLLLVDWNLGSEELSCISPVLAELAPQPVAMIHPKTAGDCALTEDVPLTITTGQGKLTLPWRPQEGMAEDLVVIPRHHLLEWQVLGKTRIMLSVEQINPTVA